MAVTDIRTGAVPSAAIKMPVSVATTGNIPLSGLQIIDGYQTVTGSRVLVKDQTSAVENGIWIASSGNWSRSSDANRTGEFLAGTIVSVSFGSVSGGVIFRQTSAAPRIGTDAINFQISGDVNPTGDKIINGAEGTLRYVEFQTEGVKRWRIQADAADNLAIERFDDDGDSLGVAVEINRATGVADYSARPAWNGIGLATVEEAEGGGGGVAGVSSFNGRTGSVTPSSGDYSSSQITYSGGSVADYLGNVAKKLVFYTPDDFGLVGNGSTDNVAAWEAMQAALPSAGAFIIWPAGRYAFGSMIQQTRPHFHIGVPNKASAGTPGTRWEFGANGKFQIFKQNGGKFAGIQFIKAASGARLFEAPDSTEAVTGSSGSYSYQSGSSYVDFEDCMFYGPATSTLVYLTNVLLYTFKYCKFINTHTSSQCRCVWLNGGNFISGRTSTSPTAYDNVDNVEFANCLFSGIDFATRTDGVQVDGKADSTKFFQCKGVWLYYGIWLTRTGPGNQVPNFTRWTQGGFENNYKNAIYAQYGDINSFMDMYASLNSSTDSNSQYGSTDVVLVDVTYDGTIEFTGCQMRAGKRSAYRLEGGRTTITGGQAANSAIRTTGYSVDIISTVTKAIITGLDCTTMATGATGQSVAIRNLKGASGVIINGCDLSGYSSAIIGTSTGAGISGNLT